jgi:hypothetical protein
MKCAGCSDATYCSPECHRTDWIAHKLLCKTVKDFQTPPKVTERRKFMGRAIFFPGKHQILESVSIF